MSRPIIIPAEGSSPSGKSGAMDFLSPHARARMQQRGIRPETVDALLDFGRTSYLRQGGREVVFFDKKAKARLARADPEAAREAEKLTRTYAIMASNGVAITVGHRFRRLPHG
jgi:hypothetical protein